MAGAASRAKSQAQAADLIRRGYWHGRRQSKGLDNIPKIGDVGSAAYRRLRAGKAK